MANEGPTDLLLQQIILCCTNYAAYGDIKNLASIIKPLTRAMYFVLSAISITFDVDIDFVGLYYWPQ